MSAGWEVGDLALCVNDSLIRCSGGINHRGVYSVAGKVMRVDEMFVDTCGCCTVLTGGDGKGGVAQRFRKILPDQHEACEAEFVTLLKRSKKRVTA